ncbi:MAG: UDP-3-O-[3-hydroxymyristoyl] glucosamine N-acyltransferase [Myxococcota bacterium]|jgi:UDP-3-O-[3-hydroxymyristoyl] glucosamine N-acyltransferase
MNIRLACSETTVALLLFAGIPRAGASPGDVDDDGILDGTDVCITVADPAQTDTDGDGLGDACAHPTASVDPSTVFHGAYIGARSSIAEGGVVDAGVVVGRAVTIGPNATIGVDTVIGPQSVLAQGVALESGVAVGYAVTLDAGVSIGENAFLGSFVHIGEDSQVGDRSALSRWVRVGANSAIGDDTVLSPQVDIGAQVLVGTGVRVRLGAQVGDFAILADNARIGRDAVIGPGGTVGIGGVVRGEATVHTDLPDGGYLPRGAVLGTPRKRIVLRNGTRAWSDGTFASSCLAYLQASGPGETYAGDTGDGVYRLTTSAAPFDATCNMTGGGWTLALRVADSGNTFTFLSPHWTNITTLNADSFDPLTDLDAKYPAFNQVVGSEIRGCLRNLSTGAYGCKTYALPNARTLLDMFANTSVGSRESNRGYYYTESRAERLQWQSMWGRSPGESSTSNNYVDTAINMDDDLSNYRARVRFGLGLNNEGNIYTLNDTIGFGASAYYNTNAGGLAESPWRVSAGAAIGGTLIRTRGQIWVR